jgi:UDP-GlcNAc:undecaprenyl-phosphate GlcNAc-1-phosphate transferase
VSNRTAAVRGPRYGAPVHALPFVVSVIAALVIAPAARASMAEHGMTRENYRGVVLPIPFGFVVPVAALVALVVLAPLQQLADVDVFALGIGHGTILVGATGIAVFCLGVAFLGLVDDALSGPSRGWRGHARAAASGQLSTGALKAVGTLGLALYVLADGLASPAEYLLAVAVLVLSTNLFNLLDLRPGRSVKVFVLLAIGLTLGAWSLDVLWALGLFAGPLLVAGLFDLRERAMLGDTGSNLIGGLAGLWLVLTLSTTGQLVALVVLLGITAYGEFRSISELVARTPVLRHLDSFGRPR